MTAPHVEVRIEPGMEKDVPVILRLIQSLAEYEELSGEVTATEESLRKSLFGESPSAEVILAYAGSEPVGFAVFFTSYSTFLGRPGLYLEDLFVLPQWRKCGYGRQLLTHVAKIAVQRACGRMEWSVLDWNEPAVRFYEKVGARPMDQWTVYRLTGDALQELASGESM
ncbi:MAG: GNAT family N-acetyltransferase [Gammaproteobacteria bacterium]|jgi:GNAT superfamily N-acetyltransferase